jgi:hypothetical protein
LAVMVRGETPAGHHAPPAVEVTGRAAAARVVTGGRDRAPHPCHVNTDRPARTGEPS